MFDESLYYIRYDKIDDVDKWLWLKTDHGAWDGPKNDWITSHKEKILKWVKEFDVVVQAGGCQGMYPRLMSDIFKVVYTFEPSPLSFNALAFNCQKKNIIKFNAALGDCHKMVAIYDGDTMNVGTHTIDQRGGIIPQLTLDDFEFEKCDLLYLDIEGYEGNVLVGANYTIDKHKPIIFAENGHNVEEYMKTIGYQKVDQSVSDSIFAPI